MMENKNIKLLYIDLFCGAGGTSTGVSMARLDGKECAEVVACVNHDPHAIASHASNHPSAVHYTEDIRTLDIRPLAEHIKASRQEHPEALVVLWASLECTNFSKAKGGMPRDADSRTLAEHLFRYIEGLAPDYIQIENVQEFMSWGDMDKDGRPISMDKGRLYAKWVQNVKEYGYDFDFRILNSADFGAYTSRRRFFGIFARHGLPIAFPEPTHSRCPESGLFPSLKKWKPVKDVLDLEDTGRSIFGRSKPLSEKTLQRIFAGLEKFINDVPDEDQVQFLSKQFSGHPSSKNITVNAPAGTITCQDHHALVTAFLDCQYTHGQSLSLDRPAPTLTTIPKHNLVTVEQPAAFLMNPQFNSCGASIEGPCFTLIARMDKKPPYLVSAERSLVSLHDESPEDSPMTRKIKTFMKQHHIQDIKMRQLRIKELLKIMGFPEDYTLVGTQREQKKYIGNAVEVNVARKWCEALCCSLLKYETRAA